MNELRGIGEKLENWGFGEMELQSSDSAVLGLVGIGKRRGRERRRSATAAGYGGDGGLKEGGWSAIVLKR